MDKKETIVFIIGALVVGSLMFAAGMIYSDNKVTQSAMKGNICTPGKLCPNALEAIKRLRDYQLEAYSDSTVIWDGDRHVATLKFDEKQALDSVIMDDNQ